LFFTLLAVVLPVSVVAEDFPAPPSATVESIAGSVTSMGMNLSIRRFKVEKPMSSVLGFYRKLWQEDASETEMPPWTMIGKIDGDHYYNVQMQPVAAGTWGYLSVSDLPEKLQDKTYKFPDGGNFPRMNGSQVIDEQISDDPGKKGRTLMISNRFSVKSNHDYYKNHYRNKGWNIVMDQQTEARQAAYALYMTKGPKSVTLTIFKDDGRTMVVANEVSRGLLR
jgi:hypothetical protein